MAIALVEKAVYYDEKYTTSWIEAKIASDIASFLSKHDFSVLNVARAFKFTVIQAYVVNLLGFSIRGSA